MRRLIPFTVLAAMLCSAGVASADHRRRDHDRGWRGGGGWHGAVVVRDHRDHGAYRDARVRVRVRPRFEQRTVFVTDGMFRFGGGAVLRWRAPVIRQRFYDVRVRPAPVVEYYDAMPGYVWVAGQWQWSGAEWLWVAGHYQVAAGYGQGYPQPAYDDGYGQGYAQPAYDDGYGQAPCDDDDHGYAQPTYPRAY